ncbi:MAG: hypothetical protein HKN24_01140 [Acidimicrobiales bacterium]|nr:hypothetical protein [Acidimicrobiales bacterium]
MIELSEAAKAYLLAFADDEHMIGSRHANWIGLGPFLEEDLAFCSIAQDELGHALALYDMFVPTGEIDRFALLREPADYRSCALAELECPTWDLALVRHWLYDSAEALRWSALVGSEVDDLGALATQALRDEAFHAQHAEMFVERVVGDRAARSRIERALAEVLPVASSVWTPPDGEETAVAEGVVTRSSASLAMVWADQIRTQLDGLGLAVDPQLAQGLDELPPASTRHHRINQFDRFHTSLGEVISLDPSAIW